jgi:hypothetical protein
MRIIHAFLLLTLLCTSSLARPFHYNLAYGPEYFYFSSNKAGISSNLVTCGIVCSGNIFDRINMEFRGGVGEISSTKINYNEFSLLYKTSNDPHSFLGLGPSFLTYENVLNKSNNTNIISKELNVKIRWAQVIAPLWGLYAQAVGPNNLSYDIGWLTYFDEYFGDFNIRFGYKEIKFPDESSMRGPYIASSIYF